MLFLETRSQDSAEATSQSGVKIAFGIRIIISKTLFNLDTFFYDIASLSVKYFPNSS